MRLVIRCEHCDRSGIVEFSIGNRLFSQLRFPCRVCGENGKVIPPEPKPKANSKTPISPDPIFKNTKVTRKYPRASYRDEESKARVALQKAAPTFDGIHCIRCGHDIPAARRSNVPGTDVCSYCAKPGPADLKRVNAEEAWGIRSDWKKDRASWKRR